MAKGRSPRDGSPRGKGKGKGNDSDSDDSYKWGKQVNRGRFGKWQRGSPKGKDKLKKQSSREKLNGQDSGSTGPKKFIIRGAKQHERRNLSAERRARARATTQKPLDHSGKIVWRPAKAAHSIPLGESRSKRQTAQAPKTGQASKNAGAAAERPSAAPVEKPPARPSGPQWKGGGGTGTFRRSSSASQTTDPRPSDAQAPRHSSVQNLPMPRFAKSSQNF